MVGNDFEEYFLLKEAYRQHEDTIFEYVQAHKKEMPLTSLRYAIMAKELFRN